MNRFLELAKSEEPRPANQCMEELRKKLQELRIFWKAAQEWDKAPYMAILDLFGS